MQTQHAQRHTTNTDAAALQRFMKPPKVRFRVNRRTLIVCHTDYRPQGPSIHCLPPLSLTWVLLLYPTSLIHTTKKTRRKECTAHKFHTYPHARWLTAARTRTAGWRQWRDSGCQGWHSSCIKRAILPFVHQHGEGLCLVLPALCSGVSTCLADSQEAHPDAPVLKSR